MIGTVLSIPAIVFTPFGLAWIWTKARRVLNPSKEAIIKRIHKGELDRIKDFAPRDLTKDVLQTDSEFWDSVGGFSGLLREFENAVCFVQLLQVYVRESKMDKRDVEYVARRAFNIAFLLVASVPAQAIRLFWRGMPHFCARWIACLYWEAETYTQAMDIQYGDGILA